MDLLPMPPRTSSIPKGELGIPEDEIAQLKDLGIVK
jgi:hypothetical protein